MIAEKQDRIEQLYHVLVLFGIMLHLKEMKLNELAGSWQRDVFLHRVQSLVCVATLTCHSRILIASDDNIILLFYQITYNYAKMDHFKKTFKNYPIY